MQEKTKEDKRGNMLGKKECTIYDIARMAGVSATTVSRVVTNHPNVKKSTRLRVQKLIEQCHYVPNETARGLVNQSSRLIGILITDVRLTHHADGVFYMEQELARHGYVCLILNTGAEEEKLARSIQLLSQRKVDAAILMGSIYQTGAVKKAIEAYLPQTPVLLCNGYLDLPNVYGVIADERNGVGNCVSLLVKKGRRHPIYITDSDTPSSQMKEQGYIEAVKRELPGVEPVTVKAEGRRYGAYAATKKLMEAHPEADGLIYADDVLATVGLHALRDMGKRVPEDVSVVGINNSFQAELATPKLTSLDNMLYDQSLTVARTILELVQGNRVVKKMMICSEIVEREST